MLADGLVAHGTHELQEAALLPETVEHVWNTNSMVNEESTVGTFLQTLFGYDGDPSLLELGAWLVFLIGAMVLFIRPLLRRPQPEPATT